MAIKHGAVERTFGRVNNPVNDRLKNNEIRDAACMLKDTIFHVGGTLLNVAELDASFSVSCPSCPK